MSPLLIVLVIVALVIVGLGLQISARQIQRFPVDTRSPGSLVESRRRRAVVVRPTDLDHLHSIVTESLSSDTVAATKLDPLLAELGAERSRSRSRSRRRRSRLQRLEAELSDLEQRWGLGSPGSGP